jgi:hypothetical protein
MAYSGKDKFMGIKASRSRKEIKSRDALSTHNQEEVAFGLCIG